MALCLTAGSLLSAGQSPRIEWEHVYPQPTGEWLKGVAWGPSGVVAVGEKGEILFSKNALAWERCPLPFSEAGLHSACFYNDKYLVVGDTGAMAWSSDGRNWTPTNAGVQTTLRTCVGGSGYFVAAGSKKSLLVSTNAIDWETRVAPADFISIAFGNGRWVAVNGVREIYTSTDLMNWTCYFLPPASVHGPVLNSVCFGLGRFIVGGASGADQQGSYFASMILHSMDGTHWENASLGNAFGEILSCSFAGGVFVAVHGQSVSKSTNGVDWAVLEITSSEENLQSVAGSGSGTWVAVGFRGEIQASHDDAETWASCTANPREYLYSIHSAAGRFVAVGGSTGSLGGGPFGSSVVLTSTDGRNWHASLTNLDKLLSAVAFGNGRWVVAGADGSLFTSTNGTNWNNRSLPGTSLDLHSLVYGAGRFIALVSGRDLLYHSTDGIQWRALAVPGLGQAQGIRYLNKVFLAGGLNGHVLFSGNGLDWHSRKTPTDSWLRAIAFGKGRYVAGGHQCMVYSLDGTEWRALSVPLSVRDLIYANGWFIAVGSPSSQALISRDGANWESLPVPLRGFSLEGLARAEDVLVGFTGFSLVRGAITYPEGFRQNLHLLGAEQIEYWGEPGRESRLERSTDLVTWTPASAWRPGKGDYLVWNTGPHTNSTRFWRASERKRTVQQ